MFIDHALNAFIIIALDNVLILWTHNFILCQWTKCNIRHVTSVTHNNVMNILIFLFVS